MDEETTAWKGYIICLNHIAKLVSKLRLTQVLKSMLVTNPLENASVIFFCLSVMFLSVIHFNTQGTSSFLSTVVLYSIVQTDDTKHATKQ